MVVGGWYHLVVVELGQQLGDCQMLLRVAVAVRLEGPRELLDAQVHHAHHQPLVVRLQAREDVGHGADAGPRELSDLHHACQHDGLDVHEQLWAAGWCGWRGGEVGGR